MRFE
jgi:hypothetical protein